MNAEPVIGLEVHVRLRTASKMFCGCANRFGAPPNTLACPVCAGLPGALPKPNAGAFTLGLRAAVALGCTIAPRTRFDRKNYFYPDQPKNYQITQQRMPLATGGALRFRHGDAIRAVAIARVHLEEDAGKTIHDPTGGPSRVDLNRAGVPLLEIVTEPRFHDPAEVRQALRELRRLVRFLDVSDGNMEEGSLRCEPNLSMRPAGATGLGTRTEIKNLNSFGAVERALRHEIGRQGAVLSSGGRVEPQTLLWDRTAHVTRPMRDKEEARDYRTFPDPDLPAIPIPPAWIEEQARALPELPLDREERFRAAFGLSRSQAAVLTEQPAMAGLFEAMLAAGAPAGPSARFLVKEARRFLREERRNAAALRSSPQDLARLVLLVEEGAILPRQAPEAFRAMEADGCSADEARRRLGLTRLEDDDTLAAVVYAVVSDHPRSVRDFAAGRRQRAVGHLMGRIRDRTAGRADPQAARRLLEAELERAAGKGHGESTEGFEDPLEA